METDNFDRSAPWPDLFTLFPILRAGYFDHITEVRELKSKTNTYTCISRKEILAVLY